MLAQNLRFQAIALERNVLSLKVRVKHLSWTSKFLAHQIIYGKIWEPKKILGAICDAKCEWGFLCGWTGFRCSQIDQETALSFVYACTKKIICFLNKHPYLARA